MCFDECAVCGLHFGGSMWSGDGRMYNNVL